MPLRFYSLVVDCRDVAAQADWWSRVLGWPKNYESAEEVCLAAPQADAVAPMQRGPELTFLAIPGAKTVKNRLHLDLAPLAGEDLDAAVERLVGLGATHLDVGQPADVTWVVLADPEGNEFCVLSPRD